MSDLSGKLMDAIEEVMSEQWVEGGLYRVNSAELVDAVFAVLADLPFEVWERCVNSIEVDDMDQRRRETIVITVLRALLESGDDDD